MFKGLEKEIDYLRDAKNHLWIASLGSFGGSITIALSNIPFWLKLSMMFIGFTFSIVFLVNYFKKGVMIEKRINFVKKKGG